MRIRTGIREYTVDFVYSTYNGNTVVSVPHDPRGDYSQDWLLDSVETGVLHDEWDYRA